MKYQMSDWEDELNCSSGEIEELMAREKANEIKKKGKEKRKMKRTINIDTDEGMIELLQDGYHIIEKTFYDEGLNERAEALILDLVERTN